MAPNSGKPADASDVWLRVLTANYWKRDGKLHNSAFTGRAFSIPPESKDYTLELSGRLLSLTNNVEKEAEAFCNPPLKYHGIIFQTVENLRSDGNSFHKNTGCVTDVIYTPKRSDNAHADLVAYGPTVESKYLIREWLQEFIQFASPGNCNIIEQLRPSTPQE